MVQLPKELTSPLVSSIVKSAKKHRDSRILSLLIGLGIILVFLTAISLAPQIGDKLGKLSVKKHNQYASADIGNPGIVSLINQWRSQNNLGPLREDQNLANAACWMANDMAAHNVSVLSHTDSLGRDPFQRMTAFGGYGNEYGAENIGAGFDPDSQGMFNAWQTSPGHNVNMLGSHYDRIGVGLAYSPTAPFRWYWVTDFASSLDSTHPYQQLTSNCVSNQQPPPPPPPPSANITASPNPCLIPSTAPGCAATVSWSTSGYTGTIYLCVSDGVSTSKVGEGPTSSSNQTLSPGKTYTYKLLLNPSDCNSGTQIQSLVENVYRINTQGGDVNCDGSVDSVDASLILKYSAQLPVSGTNCTVPKGGFDASAADFFADGRIDVLDALFILRKVSGLLVLSPSVQFTSAYEDSDKDLMVNSEEGAYSCLNNSIQDSKTDSDNDGLTNIDEITRGTNPCIPDTDRDGFSDGSEVYLGTNPNIKCSTTTTTNPGVPNPNWPPDFNNDNKVLQSDVLKFGSSPPSPRAFGHMADSAAYRRFDLNADGKIALADILLLGNYFNKSCY